MFSAIHALFSPGRRHAEEERQRLEHTRAEEGNNDPGRGEIDLASGQVLIRLPAQAGPAPGSTDPADPAAAPAATDATDVHDGRQE